jgi:hypothetical protein
VSRTFIIILVIVVAAFVVLAVSGGGPRITQITRRREREGEDE